MVQDKELCTRGHQALLEHSLDSTVLQSSWLVMTQRTAVQQTNILLTSQEGPRVCNRHQYS